MIEKYGGEVKKSMSVITHLISTEAVFAKGPHTSKTDPSLIHKLYGMEDEPF